jgi:signal peptidase II
VRRTTRLILVAIITLASVGCDQATKHFARHTLAAPERISILDGLVHLELAENRGAFLSFGSNLSAEARRFLFIICPSVLLLAVAFASLFGPRLEPGHVIGLALVLGGGVGNLIDRLFQDGVVTDFVRVSLGPVRTGIFNMSDLAIVLGVAAFALTRGARAGKRSDAT